MELRPLVYAGGMIAAGLLLPFVILFAALDRPDIARGTPCLASWSACSTTSCWRASSTA